MRQRLRVRMRKSDRNHVDRGLIMHRPGQDGWPPPPPGGGGDRANLCRGCRWDAQWRIALARTASRRRAGFSNLRIRLRRYSGGIHQQPDRGGLERLVRSSIGQAAHVTFARFGAARAAGRAGVYSGCRSRNGHSDHFASSSSPNRWQTTHGAPRQRSASASVSRQ